jgi:two-component sensor histidine kinase
VPTPDDIIRSQTDLAPADVAWVHALVADWQILADLSFADLVLWVPDAESKGLWAVAQIRPTTGATTLLEDVTGTFVPSQRSAAAARVLAGGDVEDDDDPAVVDGVRVRLVPVRRGTATIAVLAVRSGRDARATSHLEVTYRSCADAIVGMIARGEFPTPGSRSDLADSLRVGDGFIRTTPDGLVEYASPNALSAYRRLGLPGDLLGVDLAEVTASCVGRTPTDLSTAAALGGLAPAEAEVAGEAATLLLRVIPLTRVGVVGRGERDGAVVLLRDVTDLRLREKQLLSKEATIREIHHRVKNNLQTVAALLRLQARRMDVPEARAALEEAVRRVGSIAVVHETLSQGFDQSVAFDDVGDRLLRSVLDVGGPQVRAERIGSFGLLPADVATPLAMVLTELVQNAAEHAFPEGAGRVTVAANRIRDRLRMRVSDDGVGLPPDFDTGRSLGLSIVSTLVESELGGTLDFESRPGRGASVTITLTL